LPPSFDERVRQLGRPLDITKAIVTLYFLLVSK